MRNNSTRLKGKRKLQLHNIKVSSTTVWRYVTSKGWKALREKGRCTLHAGMASEGFSNFIPKDDLPTNSRDANPLVSAIPRINLYPVDSAISFPIIYPLNSDLSGG